MVSPLQSALVEKAAGEGGSALQYAFDRKMRLSGEACQSQGIVFQPLPVETLGGWHKQALEVLAKLGCQLARHIGEEDAEVQRHLLERLRILLQKGNSALILSRSVDNSTQEIDGVVDS